MKNFIHKIITFSINTSFKRLQYQQNYALKFSFTEMMNSSSNTSFNRREL